MNRFRSKKRQNESASSTRRPSAESDIPPLPAVSSRTKTFRRNKKVETQVTPEPQIDFSSALPASDEFRTSMLMPGLSARFSMLREQDDPTSKLGKANDDSVLFPKRASRLELFNRNGLSDIVEVDSLRGSIRPPFAFRTNSCSTDGGYGTDDDTARNGSIMSRAKQGEGNSMFGGRQKIYKIPVEGVNARKSGNDDGGAGPTRGMGGKFLYESDIAMSHFQQLKLREKEERDRAAHERPSTRSSKDDERSGSPPSSQYNKNRETTSSTTSGPSLPRNSTAATSVASQRSVYGGQPHANGSSISMTSQNPASHISPSSDRPNAKNKRLYGQGLDQHMHEQQHSAMHRLESLHRQRALDQPISRSLQPSRSATSLNDRYQRSGPLYSSNNLRTASPPPSATPPRMGDFDLGLNGDVSTSSLEKNDSGYGRSPPLSPPMSPTEDAVFASALEPNDVGKATASGAFNKPKRQYNEQQYLQRQLQLQQGRETPPPLRPFSPNAPPVDEKTVSRSRNDSVNSTHSTNGSIRRPEYQSYDQPLNSVPESPDRRRAGRSSSPRPPISTSFFSGFSSSETSPQTDTEPDSDSPNTSLPYQSLSQVIIKEPTEATPTDHPKESYHPSRLGPLPTSITEETASETLSQRTVTHSHNSSISKPKSGHLDADSPTLGPVTTGIGLNGLVRAHLRNDSGQSSIYPEPSPGLQAKFPNEHFNPRESGVNQSQTFFHQDTTSDDELDTRTTALPRSDQSDVIPPPLVISSRSFLPQATALRESDSPKSKQILASNKAQRILGHEAPRSSQESVPTQSWQEQLRKHHARGGSTETEKEREAFASELAERRRAVQDNLKSFVESESRSASPGPGPRNRDTSPAGRPPIPFGILRNKNSKTSLNTKAENPTKAMRMLGIDPTSTLPSPQSVENLVPDESQQRTRLTNEGQRPQMQTRQRSRPPNQRSSPPLPKPSRENRSNSDSSDRRQDVGKGRLGNARPMTTREPLHQHLNQPLNFASAPPRPVEELMASISRHQPSSERSQSANPGQLRSTGRTNPSGYFEQRSPPSAPSSIHSQAGLSPRPSPMASTHSAHIAPSIHDHPSNFPNPTSPVMITARSSPTSNRHHPAYRKGSINKHDISEPRFLSSTSSIITVDLPPEASLRNGMDSFASMPPPVPPFNPRRNRTRTFFEHLGKSEKPEAVSSPSSAQDDPYAERSTFSADEGDPKPKPSRHRLRKTSSEGGSMAAKARQQAMMAPSPAMPPFPPNAAPSAAIRQFHQDTSPESSPALQQQGFHGSATSSPTLHHHPRFQLRPDEQESGGMF
ncbi:MAG: hypothetical protein Q9195_005778 [Heterodermia aff. obscurata]